MYCCKCGSQVDQTQELCPNCHQPWQAVVHPVAKKSFSDIIAYCCFYPISLMCAFMLVVFFIVLENLWFDFARCLLPALFILFFANKYFSKQATKNTRLFDISNMIVLLTTIVILFVSLIMFIITNANIAP